MFQDSTEKSTPTTKKLGALYGALDAEGRSRGGIYVYACSGSKLRTRQRARFPWADARNEEGANRHQRRIFARVEECSLRRTPV